MTTFNAGTSSVGVDMTNLPYFFGSTIASPTHIRVASGFDAIDYFGNFQPSGTSAIGAITSIYYENTFSHYQYSATGFSLDAKTTIDLISKHELLSVEGSMLAGDDIVNGSAKSDVLIGFSGNDRIFTNAGDDTVDGGAGTDTAYLPGNWKNFNISKTLTGFKMVDAIGGQGTKTFANVERFVFSDKAFALDVDGNAGQMYRLYQAAFNRVPDAGGLGGWINYLDNGNTLKNAATFFQATPEFTSRYGANVSTADFVTLLYQNVLHRAPDAGGYADWTSLIDSGQRSRADVLIGFSESPENKAALIGVQQAGMEYIPVA